LEAADGFNDYFSNVGEITSQKDHIPNRRLHSMLLEPVLPSTIIETTRNLKSKSSLGHEKISSKILKRSVNIIAVSITHIINRSLATGLVPGKLKLAKVIPIFKSADSSQIKSITLLAYFWFSPIC